MILWIPILSWHHHSVTQTFKTSNIKRAPRVCWDHVWACCMVQLFLRILQQVFSIRKAQEDKPGLLAEQLRWQWSTACSPTYLYRFSKASLCWEWCCLCSLESSSLERSQLGSVYKHMDAVQMYCIRISPSHVLVFLYATEKQVWK